ncbi:hypothetical protein BgiMline_005017 [Biomphalaria glabrata]
MDPSAIVHFFQGSISHCPYPLRIHQPLSTFLQGSSSSCPLSSRIQQPLSTCFKDPAAIFHSLQGSSSCCPLSSRIHQPLSTFFKDPPATPNALQFHNCMNTRLQFMGYSSNNVLPLMSMLKEYSNVDVLYILISNLMD